MNRHLPLIRDVSGRYKTLNITRILLLHGIWMGANLFYKLIRKVWWKRVEYTEMSQEAKNQGLQGFKDRVKPITERKT